MISYGRHKIDSKDIKNVIKALKSDYLTSGPRVEQFENKLNKKFGGKFCTVVNNGTSALHLLGKALNWKKNDLIATTPISFIATSNCIVNNNASPVFIDIEKKTYTLDLNKLENKLKRKKFKAVIAVDYAGHPCDWEGLKFLSNKYNFTLINDACHSMGAKYKSNQKYAIKYADFVTQSFHPVKTFTTGEGGSIISKDKSIDDKIKLLRNHSMVRNKKFDPWMYKIFSSGMNYRITDLQCALGISQLDKIDKFVSERRKIAKMYLSNLAECENFILPTELNKIKHAYHLFPLQIMFEKTKFNKNLLFKIFSKIGVRLQVHYIPIHLQPFYKKNFKINRKELLNSEEFYKRVISLPIFPGIKKNHLSKIIKQLKLIN